MPESFSQRHGLVGPPAGTLVRDEVPPSFRMFLIDLPHGKVGIEIHEVHKVVCDVLQKWPDESFPPYYDYKRYIQACEWFRIYDIIEGLYRFITKRRSGFDSYLYAKTFVTAINEALVEQNIGWQLVNGKIVVRGDEAFERTMGSAVKSLESDHKPTAAGHLRSALVALSTRPKPNTSGAVAHATNAVECVLGEITGHALTLGAYLDKTPSLFHPALKKGLNGVYGFASDEGARHGREGTEPAVEDAEFAVTVCAAACTLLIRKHPNDRG